MKLDECFQKGLLKRISPDMVNADRSIKLSIENIEDAVENFSIHRYRVVVILSYTAMFHAARAILFRDGIKERSHECIPVYIVEKHPELETLANIPLKRISGKNKDLYRQGLIILMQKPGKNCENQDVPILPAPWTHAGGRTLRAAEAHIQKRADPAEGGGGLSEK